MNTIFSKTLISAIFIFTVFGCQFFNSKEAKQTEPKKNARQTSIPVLDKNEIINQQGKTIKSRFSPPTGFKRIAYKDSSFGKYLRNLPLKPHNSKVHYYNGGVKENYGVYDAVVNLPIGSKDLHQCADAIMRLRAEYLYSIGRYDEIHFNFTNGFQVDYSEWIKGKRIKISGNKTWWVQSAGPSNTPEDLWDYLELIFTYAGSASLSKELMPVKCEDMKIGDVFIIGGFPGHGVIVVDMAINKETGKKVFMLAQSYMPAQEIQVLKNPNNSEISPWYELEFGQHLKTPEYGFSKDDLKRFL